KTPHAKAMSGWAVPASTRDCQPLADVGAGTPDADHAPRRDRARPARLREVGDAAAGDAAGSRLAVRAGARLPGRARNRAPARSRKLTRRNDRARAHATRAGPDR